jgi:deoxycytidylate deaminase
MPRITSSKAANDLVASSRPIGSSQEVLREARANELFIAVVAPAGAGASAAAAALKVFLEDAAVGGQRYEVEIVKASAAIRDWAVASGKSVPPAGRKSLAGIRQMQDNGDAMRLDIADNAAVARAIVGRISAARARSSGKSPGEIDGKPRAFIIDSLRHPSEAQLLRRIYQDAFVLVGVVCDPARRAERLILNLFEGPERGLKETAEAVSAFVNRDADAPEKHGQHVTDTFHEADFFVDNSVDASRDTTNTGMNDPLRRLVTLLTSWEVKRPTAAETAMHHAHSAQLRSACMSRQVGAALLDRHGNVVATGTNEVPKAGGGVYGEAFEPDDGGDHRCLFRDSPYCSSNREQNDIIGNLIDTFPALVADRERKEVEAELRKTRIGGLIEFSRAVHAEMDAILSAARTGVSPQGCRLFVSTFPCHYCARHIVSAGIDEVQYIEPYPKSRALALHCDSITTDVEHWSAPSSPPKEDVPYREPRKRLERKVLFHPFVGVAPRLYARVFLKDRDYKDKLTGNFALGQPDWGGSSEVFKVRYADLEISIGNITT